MSHPKLFKVPHFILVMEEILHLLVVDVYLTHYLHSFSTCQPVSRICFQQFERLSVRGWRFQFQDLFRQMPSIRLGISQVGWKGITAMVGIDTLAIWIRVHYKEKQAKWIDIECCMFQLAKRSSLIRQRFVDMGGLWIFGDSYEREYHL